MIKFHPIVYVWAASFPLAFPIGLIAFLITGDETIGSFSVMGWLIFGLTCMPFVMLLDNAAN